VLIGRRNVVARAVITEVVPIHSEQLRKLAPILTSQCEAAAHWFRYSLSLGTGLPAHILWIFVSAEFKELRMAKIIDFCSSSSICTPNSGFSQQHCAIFSPVPFVALRQIRPLGLRARCTSQWSSHLHEPAADSASCHKRQRSTVSMSNTSGRLCGSPAVRGARFSL